MLQYFSWWIYAFVGVFYTGFEFGGGLRSEIFSKRNTRSLSAIFSIHLVFLTILLALMRLAVSVSHALPNWATDTFRVRGGDWSVLDMLYIIAMFAMHSVEQRLIYVDSKNKPSF